MIKSLMHKTAGNIILHVAHLPFLEEDDFESDLE
jgi:hypothetical protein